MNRARKLQVTTGSRLHFGLFSVGQVGSQPQFGGCGLMVKDPGNQIVLCPELSKQDPDLEPFVQRWFENVDRYRGDVPPPTATLQKQAARHCGFGSGTQLALAVGLALSTWYELALGDAEQLSTIMRRGLRSAIGAHGFFRGGFLVDRGKRKDGKLASLDMNLEFPESWPVLVLNLKVSQGLHGPEEVAAFKQIPTSSRKHRERMVAMVKDQIAPAIAARNYDDFAEVLFEYGRSSGSAYASIQGGDFHSPPIENLVYRVREFGVPAVGQSSWGPCVFAITRNDDVANSLSSYLADEFGDSLNITKTIALNKGAEIKWLDSE